MGVVKNLKKHLALIWVPLTSLNSKVKDVSPFDGPGLALHVCSLAND